RRHRPGNHSLFHRHLGGGMVAAAMNAILKNTLVSSFILAATAIHANPAKTTRCDGMGDAPTAANMAIKAAGSPVVSNVESIQIPGPGGSSQVVVTYDLSAAGNCTVSLQVSDDGGAAFDIVPQTLSGAV